MKNETDLYVIAAGCVPEPVRKASRLSKNDRQVLAYLHRNPHESFPELRPGSLDALVSLGLVTPPERCAQAGMALSGITTAGKADAALHLADESERANWKAEVDALWAELLATKRGAR